VRDKRGSQCQRERICGAVGRERDVCRLRAWQLARCLWAIALQERVAGRREMSGPGYCMHPSSPRGPFCPDGAPDSSFACLSGPAVFFDLGRSQRTPPFTLSSARHRLIAAISTQIRPLEEPEFIILNLSFVSLRDLGRDGLVPIMLCRHLPCRHARPLIGKVGRTPLSR
jgi:hypothetical protein